MKQIIYTFLVILTFISCDKEDLTPLKYPQKVDIELRAYPSNKTDVLAEITYYHPVKGFTNLKEFKLPFSIKYQRTVKALDMVSFNLGAYKPKGSEIVLEILVNGKLVKKEYFVNVGYIQYQFPIYFSDIKEIK